MNSLKRWHIADLILEYLESQPLHYVEVSARDIVNFHGMPRNLCIPVSALLKQICLHKGMHTKYGFRVIKLWNSKSTKYPNRYTIKLMESEGSRNRRVYDGYELITANEKW